MVDNYDLMHARSRAYAEGYADGIRDALNPPDECPLAGKLHGPHYYDSSNPDVAYWVCSGRMN